MSSGTAPPGDDETGRPDSGVDGEIDDAPPDGPDDAGDGPHVAHDGDAGEVEGVVGRSGERVPRDRRDRPDLARRRHPDSPARPHRRRWLIGILAALLVIAIGTTVTVLALGRRPTDVSTPPPTAGSPSSVPGGLTTADLLSPAEAALILPDVSWRVTSDQTGQSATGSRAACLSTESTDQAPDPEQTLTRSLGPVGAAGSSSASASPSSTSGGASGSTPGSTPSSTPGNTASSTPSDSGGASPSASTGPDQNVPVVLHQALAFADASAATETYAVFARALGNCDLASTSIAAGSSITGLGDQSTGIVLADPPHQVDRTVVINRTGTVVNVIDLVTRSNGSTSDDTIGAVVKALTKITDRQCTDALGICASLVRVSDGPPPVAGDQPGFLALADIPQPQSGTGTWAGLTPGKAADLVTSGCENVDFGDTGAEKSAARSYLLSDKPAGMPQSFGLDEAVFTFDGAKAAGAFATKLDTNLKGCKDRRLTATVSGGDKTTGHGAGGVAITATTWTIDQKVSDSVTSHFRVGVAVTGDQVVYTFLPTDGQFDLTDAQWSVLTVRAAQRATQAV